MNNGFVIMLQSKDIVWAYHFGLNDEAKAKNAFVKLVVSKFNLGKEQENEQASPSEIAERLREGEWKVQGMIETWRVEVGDWSALFMPTMDMAMR